MPAVAFAALGLGAALVQVIGGLETDGVAVVVVAAALCYLAAAALARPWVAWVAIVGGTAVIIASEAVGLTWWVGAAAAAAALVAVGARRRGSLRQVLLQAVAFVGFGGAAVLSAQASPRVGLAVVGAVLALHAVWDVAHWRRHAVVPRSLAEFCVFLDVPLGLAAIVVAMSP